MNMSRFDRLDLRITDRIRTQDLEAERPTKPRKGKVIGLAVIIIRRK